MKKEVTAAEEPAEDEIGEVLRKMNNNESSEQNEITKKNSISW